MPLAPAALAPRGTQPTRGSFLKRLGSFLAGCLGLMALGGVVLMVASWFVGDRSVWWQMLSWIPAIVMVPVLGVGAALAFMVGGWFGKWLRASLFIGFLFMLSWVCGVDYGLFRARPVEPTDHVLVHWNAGSLWGLAPTDGLVEDLAVLDPDLLVVTNPGSKLWTRATTEYQRSWEYVARNHGALVMSRLPISACRVILAAKGVIVVRIVVEFQERSVTIWAVDLPSEPGLVRSTVFADLRRRLGSLELEPPDIVLGDFNVPRNSRALHEMFPQMRNAFDQVGVGWHGTWPSEFPLWQLDQVLLGPEVEGVRYQIFPSSHGAHRIQQAVIRPVRQGSD